MRKKWQFRDEENKHRHLLRAFAKAQRTGADPQTMKDWYISYLAEYDELFARVAEFPQSGQKLRQSTERYTTKTSGKDRGAVIKWELGSNGDVLISCPEDWL